MLPVIYRNFIRISGVRGEGKKKREEQCLTFFEFTTRFIIPLLEGGKKSSYKNGQAAYKNFIEFFFPLLLF